MATESLILDKMPPQSVEAETSVIGSMLIDADAAMRAMELLSPESFYSRANAALFGAISSLAGRGQAVDIVTVAEQLRTEGRLESVGGMDYLSRVLDAVPTAANLEHYARIVAQKALLRSLIAAATEIVTRSYGAPEDVDEFLDSAEQLIFDAVEKKDRKDVLALGHFIHETVEEAEVLMAHKPLVTGVPSGFADFDKLTSGFHPSELAIIAARPSVGKTAFALNVAHHAAVKGKVPVAVFSLEMSGQALAQRMLCSAARVNLQDLRTGFLSQAGFDKLIRAAEVLNDAPIFVDDTGGMTIMELRAKCRRLRARQGIRLILIDYLQLVRAPGRAESRQQEIAEISMQLKAMAKELSVPVVACAQLSREVERRGEGARPRLSDLRESGSIEQDADLVAFLHRPTRGEDLEAEAETPGGGDLVDMIIGKQRNGPVGEFKLVFLGRQTRFADFSRRE